jgi:uncharacterized OB-fold protein
MSEKEEAASKAAAVQAPASTEARGTAGRAPKAKAIPRPTALTRAFWEGARTRQLLLQYDALAGRYQFFPRPVSIFSNATPEWREASGRGTLVALTVCRTPAPGFESDVPYAVGLVKLEEGPRIFAQIVNAGDTPVRIGQAMRLVWDDSRADYPVYQFEPVR